jgi:hypothetical protein
MEWLLKYLKDEADQIMRAPLAFVVFVLFGFILGYVVATWYYEKRLTEQEGTIGRYRVALGLDKPSAGNLIDLSNSELKKMAENMAGRLRAFDVGTRNATQSAVAGSKDEKDKGERTMRVLRDRSDEFDRTMRSDAILLDTELRRRLGPQALASIVGLPPTFYSASDNAPVGIMSLLSSNTGMSAGFVAVLADGLDQMAKLLPDKG